MAVVVLINLHARPLRALQPDQNLALVPDPGQEGCSDDWSNFRGQNVRLYLEIEDSIIESRGMEGQGTLPLPGKSHTRLVETPALLTVISGHLYLINISTENYADRRAAAGEPLSMPEALSRVSQ